MSALTGFVPAIAGIVVAIGGYIVARFTVVAAHRDISRREAQEEPVTRKS